MKSLWKTILDGLTYKDLAGKRQPRIYTVVTGLILLLLFMAGGMAGLNRYLLMSRVQATPEAVAFPTQTMSGASPDPGRSLAHIGPVRWKPVVVIHADHDQRELPNHPASLCISRFGEKHCLGVGSP